MKMKCLARQAYDRGKEYTVVMYIFLKTLGDVYMHDEIARMGTWTDGHIWC
jgi:hypothetical protein